MILFDTSIFIAGFITTHPRHEPCLSAIQKVHKGNLKAAISCHSVAESYSVLSAYPSHPKITPAVAEKLIEENILKYFEVIELSLNDYRKAIARVREANLSSGAIFDSLIIQAAHKKNIRRIYSGDLSDFTRLSGSDIEVSEP
ncbi:MAG: PIN domain-containing protein [Deltaproteobacteria bacterium]|nr:MAG: PIN domain-containing protein [Deltaproteobacteria bacterium]